MRVPEYQQSVSQQGLPDARQTTHYTADDFMGGTEKAALGYGVELAGNLANDAQKVAVKHYEDQLKQARDARVLDANTKMMTHVQDAMYGENGALNKTGEAAFLGSDGKTVSDIAYDDMVKQQQAISDGLGDDEQKAMFNAHSMPMLTSMRQSLMNHEAESHRVYVRSTLEANNAAQVNNIGLNYNDNDGMRKSIDQINLNSAQLAKTNGQGAEAGAVIAQTHISGALNKVINSALDKGDFATAHNVLKNFAPNMNTDDLTTAYSKIAKGKGEATALSTAFSTVESMKPQMMPNDGDRAFNVALQAESPTGQFLNGKPVISPKGAVGAAQVMKDTGPEAAKLAGLPWDENRWMNDQSYNIAIGKAYFQKQLQDNNGDLDKAYAAYNGGPGALKTAIANAKDGNWLALMRPETQQYVSNNLEEYNAGGGKPALPTKQDVVYAAINALPAGSSAEVVKATMQNTEHLFELQTQATKQNEDSVVSQVMTELHKNGGDINAVPQSLKSQIPGDKIGAVQDFAVKTAKGIPIETDDKLFYDLYRDPARLKLTNLLAFRDQLNDSDLRTLQKLQLDDNKDSDITTVRPAKAVLDDYMGEIGINPNPKPDDAEGSAKVGKIYGQFQTKLNNFEESVGRKATPDEIKKQAAELFTQIDIKGRFWGTNKSSLAQMKDTDVIVVPAEDRVQITQLYKAKNGGVSPSDDYILSTYKAHKGIN